MRMIRLYCFNLDILFYFIFTNLVLNDWNTLSKAQCVGFRGSYEKKSNMI